MSLTEFQLPRLIVIAILKVGTQRVAEMELSSQAVFFCYPKLNRIFGLFTEPTNAMRYNAKIKVTPATEMR